MDLATAAALATLIITGPARVVDGDTVSINDTFTSPSPIHVRLKGVDAAEMNTELGRRSRQTMLAIVGRSNLTCYLTGEKTYKRDVGYCFTDAGVDINKEIISRGAALACPHYDPRYVPFETDAAVFYQQRASYCGKPETVSRQPALEPELAAEDPADKEIMNPTVWKLLGIIAVIWTFFPNFGCLALIGMLGGRYRRW